MTHASVPPEIREELGCEDGLVRLSVGIEQRKTSSRTRATSRSRRHEPGAPVLRAGIPLAAPSGAASHLRGTAERSPRWNMRCALRRRGGPTIAVVGCDDLSAIVALPLRRWPRWLRRRVNAGKQRMAREPSLRWRAVGSGSATPCSSTRGCDGRPTTGSPTVEFNALTLERTISRAKLTGCAAGSAVSSTRTGLSRCRVGCAIRWTWAARQTECASFPMAPRRSHRPPGTTRTSWDATVFFWGHGGLRAWHGGVLLKALLEAMPEAHADHRRRSTRIDHPRAIHPPWLPRDVLAAHVAAMDVARAHGTERSPWFGPLKLADYRSQGTPIVASRMPTISPAHQGVGEASLRRRS